MKKITTPFFLVLLLTAASGVRAQCEGPKCVAFLRGTTTAVIKGAVGVRKAVCYQLRARAGQRMIVHLTSPTKRALHRHP